MSPPNSPLPTPHSPLSTLNSQLPTPHSQLSTFNSQLFLRLRRDHESWPGGESRGARFEPSPGRRATCFAWPAARSPLQPYGISPPAKSRMPAFAGHENAPAGLHEWPPGGFRTQVAFAGHENARLRGTHEYRTAFAIIVAI